MQRNFFENRDQIVVAVAFDDQTSDLVQMGVDLCKRMKKSLRLVHVCEPWSDVFPSRPFSDHSPLWDVMQAAQDNTSVLAEKRLIELEEKISKDLTVTSRVFIGKPGKWLAAEGLANHACMIVVGGGLAETKFIPRGLSTALSLMAESQVPVLVVPQGQTLDFTKTNLKLMVADDLSEQGLEVAHGALDVAASLGDSEIHHVHVNGLTLDNLKIGIESAMAASHSLVNGSVSADEVYNQVVEQLEQKLKARATGRESRLKKSGCEIIQEIVTGNVEDQLHLAIENVAPDLLVFGRHHTIHHKPFLIGRLPFKAMLAQHRPMLVVPG